MKQVQLAGVINKIQRLTQGDKETQVYAITVGVKNEYPNKEGEHKGKYGRQFFEVKHFANSEKAQKFVEETLAKVEREKTPVAVRGELRNNNYTNADGEKQYRVDIVAQDIIPFL